MSLFALVIGLLTSAVYIALLVLSVRRAVERRGAYAWLVPVIALVLLGSLAHLPADQPLSAPASLYFYSAGLVVFGALSMSYLQKPGERWWLIGGGVWWLLMVAVDLLGGTPTLGTPGWIAAVFAPSPLVSGVLALAGWLTVGVLLIILAFHAFYIASLPEVANRALFWTLVIPMMLVGVLLAASESALLTEAGWLAGLAGVLGASYGVATHRVFDVRRALRRGVGILVATLVTAIVILFALFLAEALRQGDDRDVLVLAALALVIAALYVPLRELAEWVAREIFRPPTDPAQVLRLYSQRIAAVIDLDEVVQLAIQTLVRVLRVRPGGLVLASEEDGKVTLEPMPGTDGAVLPPEKGTMSTRSPIYHRLFVQKAPLLQFDLEFSRDYTAATVGERAYFQTLHMSAYAPIVVDGRTIGVLASGAKGNDEPYHDSDLAIMATIANQTGIALRNARLVTDLRELNKDLEGANLDFAQLDRVKTDFITIASHELRTPLAQIRGYTDIIEALNEQGMLDPTQMASMTRNLRKAGERMEELISDMLDMSKLDVDAMDLHFTQTSMEAVIRLAIEPLTEAIQSRKLSLSARGLRGLPALEADMQRLVQAFRNVIVNAVKYTPDGGQIDIRAYMDEHDDAVDELHVEVRDTGIGIDVAYHELIFEKFFRVADPSLHSTGATKFMGAGPGLGLTIAKGMIEGHGGRLWVESSGYDPENLPGSVFHVVLPLRPPADARRVLPFAETILAVSTEDRKDLMAAVAIAEAAKAAKEAQEEKSGDNEKTPLPRSASS